MAYHNLRSAKGVKQLYNYTRRPQDISGWAVVQPGDYESRRTSGWTVAVASDNSRVIAGLILFSSAPQQRDGIHVLQSC